MAITPSDFHPVVVTSSPSTATGTTNTHRQPFPDGTGPEALRVVRASEVRPGDWYLGTCEGPSTQGGRLRSSVYSSVGYAARPRLRRWRRRVALDGTNFRMRSDDLVMIVPSSLIADDDWLGESFIWEPGDLKRY